MLSIFICGTTFLGSGSSSPRRSLPSKHDKNLYSSRGLDKFEALLADLEEKKKKIYTQTGPGNISFIRFAYTNSNNDPVPIVVKLKDKNGQPRSPPNPEETSKDELSTHQRLENQHQSAAVKEVSGEEKVVTNNKNQELAILRGLLSRDRWSRPGYYVPAAIVLILVLLVFFGRSVAILFTSIGWYAVPMLSESSAEPEKNNKKDLSRRSSDNRIVVTRQSPDRSEKSAQPESKKKKELSRWSSENKIVVARQSPGRPEKAAGPEKNKKELCRRSSDNGILVTQRSPDGSPGQHGHRRSW